MSEIGQGWRAPYFRMRPIIWLNRNPNAGEQFPQQLEMLRLLLGPVKVLKLPDASPPVAGPHLFNRQVPQAYG